jgi:hypothetical protein
MESQEILSYWCAVYDPKSTTWIMQYRDQRTQLFVQIYWTNTTNWEHLVFKHTDKPFLLHQICFILLLTLLNCFLQNTYKAYIMSAHPSASSEENV